MSLMIYFFKAWVIGFALSAYPGPIGMLYIQKTLTLGVRGALAVALGAAAVDVVYVIIAFIGLDAVSHFFSDHAFAFKLVGGTFLLYLAYKEINHKMIRTETVRVNSKHFIKLASQVFLITFTNPVSILSFIAIFASITGGHITREAAVVMVFGVLVGALAWWFILGTLVFKLKHKLPESWIERMRYLSAIILGGFGVAAIVSAALSF